MAMDNYLYRQFEFSESYRQRIIELVRHNTNVEIGGYRLYDGSGTHYMQNPVEITDFIFAAKRGEQAAGRKFESFLEIGFSAGINNTFVNKFFQFSRLVAVDIISPCGLDARTFMANMRFKNLTMICGNSMDPSVVERAQRLGGYDLIFIDGGHDYTTVKADFAHYGPMLNPGGVIALHDIAARDHPGVEEYWNELCAHEADRWNFQEIVDRGNHTDYGIGVVTRK